jgi:hypothetical protein
MIFNMASDILDPAKPNYCPLVVPLVFYCRCFIYKQRLNCVFLITLVHKSVNLSFVLQYRMQEVEITRQT